MSTEINDGGPAFPAPDLGEQDFGQRGAYPGMTLRDYFAAKALTALIACEKDYKNRGAKAVPTLAAWSYEYADAMLRARAATKEQS